MLRSFGLVLGLVGALLDFYSAYLLYTANPMVLNEQGMAVQSGAGVVWGFGIAALGVVLAVTVVGAVLTKGLDRMKDFGALMVVYGVVMLFVGGYMLTGLGPMMQGTLFPGIGMLVVGALMILNGGLMARPRM
jgi:hypothetical protein